MGLLSRLLNPNDKARRRRSGQFPVARSQRVPTDGQALERYRYMIQTATPETIEQAHSEAFARLTPGQRRQIVRALARLTPSEERAAIGGASRDDPRALARAATRAEIREPGVIERTLAQPELCCRFRG
jgi:hypothetical protein